MSEELYLIEGDGRRRKAERFNCKNCCIRFLRRLNGKQQFCTAKCGAISSRTRIEVLCSNCKAKFLCKPSRMRITKNEAYFCTRKCKDFAQSVDGNCEAIKPIHYGRASFIYNAKNFINRTKSPECAQCKCAKRYLLVMHHIDGNNGNNKSDNLEIVCGSCHMKRHLEIVDGSWRYNSSCLTPRDKIRQV